MIDITYVQIYAYMYMYTSYYIYLHFISLCNNLRREIIFYLPSRYEETEAKEGEDHSLRKYWRPA